MAKKITPIPGLDQAAIQVWADTDVLIRKQARKHLPGKEELHNVIVESVHVLPEGNYGFAYIYWTYQENGHIINGSTIAMRLSEFLGL